MLQIFSSFFLIPLIIIEICQAPPPHLPHNDTNIMFNTHINNNYKKVFCIIAENILLHDENLTVCDGNYEVCLCLALLNFTTFQQLFLLTMTFVFSSLVTRCTIFFYTTMRLCYNGEFGAGLNSPL
jgi:hypothetical protein